MQPVTFNGCFGWLHKCLGDAESDVAVLICPGLYRDALDSYHALRLLADELAMAGYPTMRFGYPGTGDSCDTEDGEQWAIWQQSVHAAADWLRNSTGARRLIFCGLRIGAMLATLAVERRDDVAGLVLLAPVLSGQSYMRQLRIEAQLRSGLPVNVEEGLNFHELHFSAKTVHLISQMDLRQAKLHAGHKLMICAQSPSSILTECKHTWSKRGAEITCAGFDGLESVLRYNLHDKGPSADFSAIIRWARRAVPARRIPLPYTAPPSFALLELPGCTETPLRFGPGERLFGMLCRPTVPVGTMAVIIGNTGRDPHYGSGRFGVEFARRLAADGIASLRMDFAGLGDSIGAAGQENVLSSLFENDRAPDISAAVDALRRLGYQQFTMQGICAGAYHAFRGALADPRIKTLLLINMPVFTWRSGDTVDFVTHKRLSPSHYLSKLTRKDIWIRLLQGKLDLGCVFRAQRERLYERVQKKILRPAARLDDTGSQDFARRAMGTLSRRRTRTLFLFAPGDRGIQALEQEFGHGGAGLRAFNGASMQVVPGIDHMLSDRLMRRTIVDLIVSFLAESPGATDYGSAPSQLANQLWPVASLPSLT